GRGDFARDTMYQPGARRMGVTELMQGFTTATITWVPERPGNWLFHCHLVQHMAPLHGLLPDTPSATHATHAAPAGGSAHDPRDHMAGMVMGIHVRGRDVHRAESAVAPQRRLDLFVQSRDSALARGLRGYGFVLGDPAAPPPRDSIRRPGAPIVLVRGARVAIRVHNRLAKPLAVHWHGMEIESWFDGVGGSSGAGRSVRPPIAPGDSFVVRLTAARAGTFIYHTHDEAGSELSTGLYGALIVEEPNAPRDTTRDHVIVMGLLGDAATGSLAINGRTDGAPLTLSPGTHRLRFVSIPVDEQIRVAFVRDSTVQRWRSLATDGAELPAAQQVQSAARRTVSAGQTFDVEVTIPVDAPTNYALRFTTVWYPTDARGAQPAPVLRVPIVVRPP
ncbi:multicopper oxidase domain-containing protein, partial [Gemmatimonas sp.]|uniref:multicopper oxidase domain-containing protein n=1 Tax=Gemmatimonas sp. TaxID=1962908 RepID=UPI00286DC2F0